MCTKYFFKIRKTTLPFGITHSVPPHIVGSVDLRIVQGSNTFQHNKIFRFNIPVDSEPWSKKFQAIKAQSATFLKNHLLRNIDDFTTESESEEEFVWVSNNP